MKVYHCWCKMSECFRSGCEMSKYRNKGWIQTSGDPWQLCQGMWCTSYMKEGNVPKADMSDFEQMNMIVCRQLMNCDMCADGHMVKQGPANKMWQKMCSSVQIFRIQVRLMGDPVSQHTIKLGSYWYDHDHVHVSDSNHEQKFVRTAVRPAVRIHLERRTTFRSTIVILKFWLVGDEEVRTEIRIASDRIRPAVRPKFCSSEQKVGTHSVWFTQWKFA